MAQNKKREHMFNTCIDALILRPGLEGIKVAERALPYWSELISQRNKDRPEAKALLSHIKAMLRGIEDSIIRSHVSKGALQISRTQLEIEKIRSFAAQLNDTSDDVMNYFDLLKRFLFSINVLNPLATDTALMWESMVKKMPEWTIDKADKLSTESIRRSSVDDNTPTASYYFEDLVSVAGSPIEYDPIYSTPPGVMPSELMRGRMKEWEKSKQFALCKCKPLSREITLHSRSERSQLETVLNQLVVQYVDVVLHPKPESMPIPTENHQLSIQSADTITDENVKILKTIESFIESLIVIEDSDESILEISMSFIKELISGDLPKIAVPFLVSLLHGALCDKLHSMYRKEAYKILVDILQKIQPNKIIKPFEQFILKATCEYISNQKDLSELPNLETTLIHIWNYLSVKNTKEFVLNTTDCICMKQCSIVWYQAVQYCISNDRLELTDSATHTFLQALLEIAQNQIYSAINLLVCAVWKNADLCNVASKVVASILPISDYFQMVNSMSRCPLVICPEGSELKLYHHEGEIRKKLSSNRISPKEAAMQYLDLMVNNELIHYSHQKVTCLLNAARYFAIELETMETTPDHQQPLKFALRNAVTSLTHNASQLSLRLQPGFRVFALASAYRLTCRVANISDPSQHSCLSGQVACNMLRNLLHNSKFTFLLSQPVDVEILQWVAASSYVNKVSDLAHQAYIKQLALLSKTILTMKHSLLYYQCLETLIRNGKIADQQFKEQRLATMSKLLKEKRWTFEHVSNAMKTPLLERNSKGFIEPNTPLGGNLEISELKGVVFDYESSSIQLLVKLAKDGNGLLLYRDILEVLQLHSNETDVISFSLDPPSGTEQYHPFMSMRCHPVKLQNTQFMNSLFQADYLLKFLTTGIEVSAEYPFDFKPVHESLAKNLPDNLKFIRRPPYLCKMSHMTSHRFWIEAEQILYDEDINEKGASYSIGDVKMSVKSRALVTALNGQSFDSKHSEQGPHYEFAAELTNNYDSLSKHFPIFARVKELSKLQFFIQKLHDKPKAKKGTPPDHVHFESFKSEITRLQSLNPINNIPDCCTWVPATYGNSVYGGMLMKVTKNSAWEYLASPGADSPNTAISAPCFSDVHKVLLNDVNPFLHREGGICFRIHEHCRANFTDAFGTDVSIVCIQLREIKSVSDSEYHTLQEAKKDKAHGNPPMHLLSPDQILISGKAVKQHHTSLRSQSTSSDNAEFLSTSSDNDEFLSCESDTSIVVSAPESSKEELDDFEYQPNVTLDDSTPIGKQLPNTNSETKSEHDDQGSESSLFAESEIKGDRNESEIIVLLTSESPKDALANINNHLSQDDSTDGKKLPKTTTELTISEHDDQGSDIKTSPFAEIKTKDEKKEQNSSDSEATLSEQHPRKSNTASIQSIEYNIDSVVDKCISEQKQIALLTREQPHDSLSMTVRQSLVNHIIFGDILESQDLRNSLKSTYNFDETNFHPNAFARQQIKTALVLRKIVELHLKRGTLEHIISFQ